MGCLASQWGIGLWSLEIWRLVVMLVATGAWSLPNLTSALVTLMGVWDSVHSLGYQVVGVRVIIGAGVVADPALVGLMVLHRV